MNRQEALKILNVADKSDEAIKVIDDAVRRANAAYEAIRRDPDLNDDAKRRRITEHYNRANEALTNELVRMAKRETVVDRDDAAAVFGTKGLAGDPASLMISRRDAADRVATTVNARELRELLARATRSGDEVLARAVAEKAMAERDAKTLNQFTADRPALEAAVERLWKAENAAQAGFQFTARLMGFKPKEAGGW